jgi:hypothetical protein
MRGSTPRAQQSGEDEAPEGGGAHPAEARLYFVEVLRGDHELLNRHVSARARMVELFARELGRRLGVGELPRVQVELVIGAGFHAVSSVVADGRVDELPSLQRELISRVYVFEPVPV